SLPWRCAVEGAQEGLRELGFAEVRFSVRSAEGKADRLAELATELVRENVDVIVLRRRRRRSKLRPRSRSSWTQAIRWEWGSSRHLGSRSRQRCLRALTKVIE